MTTSAAPIYVVDDDESVREALGSLIRSAGLRVETFASAQEFLASRWVDVPSCLVLDVQLPGLSGLELQQRLLDAGRNTSIIFLTGHADVPTSVRAMKAGALDFLTKPFADAELLNAIRQSLARNAPKQPRRPTRGERSQDDIIGTSRGMKAVLEQVDVVAPTESTVLILGETGTGKELVARAIHQRSSRSSRPFVQVNCAAIPPALVASELFGHEKGAFTGALQRRLGRFELAEGGTIFLDEIGDLPAETQVALLRVLQEREFERVGGHQSLTADVRIIAATNRDLQAAIADGSFRSDLYYRLHVFPIHVLPLRARRDDIPLLIDYFIERHSGKSRKRIRGVARESLERFQAYSWPGNVRELQNIIERSLIVCDGDYLSVDESWLVAEPMNPMPTVASQPLSATLAGHERAIIESALAETGGLVSGPSGAAAKLGMPSSTLESKIRTLNIDKHRFKPVYRRDSEERPRSGV
jgi:DNA-binding NtrC family response regulator